MTGLRPEKRTGQKDGMPPAVSADIPASGPAQESARASAQESAKASARESGGEVVDRLRDILGGLLTGLDCRAVSGDDVTVSPRSCMCPHSFHFGLRPHAGQGAWEFLRLSGDMLVCLAHSRYFQDFAVAYRPAGTHYVFRFLASGDISVCHDRRGRFMLPAGRASLLQERPGQHTELRYPGEARLHTVTVFISARYMKRLCGLLAPESRALFEEMLRGDRARPLYDAALSPQVRGLIRDLQDSRFPGKLRHFFIRAKIDELLCFVLRNFCDMSAPAEEEVLGDRDLRKLREIYALYEQELAAPPQIDAISKQFGLNRTKLRKGFRQLYGKTIFEHSQDQRMQKARDLLCERDMNITQIAEELGYGHATNFTASFKKYYDMLPKDYRKTYRLATHKAT